MKAEMKAAMNRKWTGVRGNESGNGSGNRSETKVEMKAEMEVEMGRKWKWAGSESGNGKGHETRECREGPNR